MKLLVEWADDQRSNNELTLNTDLPQLSTSGSFGNCVVEPGTPGSGRGNRFEWGLQHMLLLLEDVEPSSGFVHSVFGCD